MICIFFAHIFLSYFITGQHVQAPFKRNMMRVMTGGVSPQAYTPLNVLPLPSNHFPNYRHFFSVGNPEVNAESRTEDNNDFQGSEDYPQSDERQFAAGYPAFMSHPVPPGHGFFPGSSSSFIGRLFPGGYSPFSFPTVNGFPIRPQAFMQAPKTSEHSGAKVKGRKSRTWTNFLFL